MSGWQPIETAPKGDGYGPEVILWLPHIQGHQRERWIVSRWLGRYWGNEYSNGPAYNINARPDPVHGFMVARHEDIKPSHWMPTPTAPEESSK